MRNKTDIEAGFTIIDEHAWGGGGGGGDKIWKTPLPLPRK